MLQFLWQSFSSLNSVIYVFCRIIISVLDCSKRAILIFNLLSYAAAYFLPDQALGYILCFFCNLLILVVSTWSNFWKSYFSFCITPWSFTITSLLLFSCYNCFKSTSLSVTDYSDIYLASFCKTLKKESFLRVGKPVLICYLFICLCLFRNHLSVSKLNFLLLFLPFLLISSLSVVLGWFRLLSLFFTSLH